MRLPFTPQASLPLSKVRHGRRAGGMPRSLGATRRLRLCSKVLAAVAPEAPVFEGTYRGQQGGA